MRRLSLVILAAAATLTLASCSASGGGGDAPEEGGAVTDLQIIVPAEPGGGWDQT